MCFSTWLVLLSLGVRVGVSLHIWVLLSLHRRAVALVEAQEAPVEAGVFPSLQPPPFFSTLTLGSTDPSRRLEAGAAAVIFSSSAPLPSPTQLAGEVGRTHRAWGTSQSGMLGG